MKKELDELLCKKFPKMFVERNMPMSQTCMCWGFDHGDGWFNLLETLCFQIQSHIDQSVESNKRTSRHNAMVMAARAGDLTLFEKSYAGVSGQWKDQYLAEILKAEDEGKGWSRGLREIPAIVPQVVVKQVKEKFGGLRFYIQGGDDEIWGMVRLAEAISTHMCEECGAPGKIVGKGWIKTLCPAHYREGDEGTEREIKWEPIPDASEE